MSLYELTMRFAQINRLYIKEKRMYITKNVKICDK